MMQQRVSLPRQMAVTSGSVRQHRSDVEKNGRRCCGVRVSASEEKPAAAVESSSVGDGSVTIEYQRQQAKAMQAYFREKSLEATIADSQLFGWTKKNEINNGRWVMMGFAIGLLTEYATGVDFINQVKLMVSYLGIADMYD